MQEWAFSAALSRSLRMTELRAHNAGLKPCATQIPRASCKSGLFLPLGVEWKVFAEVEHLLADFGERGRVSALVQHLGDPAADLFHLRFFHAARGERGRADAYARGLKRRISVERNRVLVDGDAGLA